MLNVFKGDLNKSIHKIYENTNKLWNETKKTVQDMKVKINSIKEFKPEAQMEMKNLGSQIESSVVRLIKSIQEKDKRISDTKDKIEETHNSVKENIKSNNI